MTVMVHRRSVVRGMAACAASSSVLVFGPSSALEGFIPGPICSSARLIRVQAPRPDWAEKPTPKIIRKSAESMTDEEVRRFKRAFEFAVAKGYFDIFCDEHNNHDLQHNHGAEIDPNTPITISVMPPAWGQRLLPWHRAFILEGEAMLRAALRRRNKQEGKDEREADLLFIPWWNATAGQKLPKWVEDFQPKGGTALVVAGLPKGHAGYGKPVGTRYKIEFGRWPGTLPGVNLPTTDNIRDMMSRTEFANFVAGFDTEARLVSENVPKAKAALKVLERKFPDDPSIGALERILDKGTLTRETTKPAIEGPYEIAWRVGHVTPPDPALIPAMKDVFDAIYFSPHARMHLWASGINPKNIDVRGTVTYFNELAVDPAFWMIHEALDRAWYMWEEAYPGKKPPLTGDDELFNPLTEIEGAWYGGGKLYTLDDLTDHEKLPYTYSELPGGGGRKI